MGDLFLPETDPPPQGFPVVLTIHGGGWAFSAKESFEGVSLFLAANGFAVFNINYRLAPANRYPACVDDTLKAARFLLQHEHLKPSKIYLVGGSAGGHLALMAGLSLPPESVGAIVSISGIDDVFADYALFPKRYAALWGGPPTEAELHRMNPSDIYYPGAPPILCTHFCRDTVVPIESCRTFVRKICLKANSYYIYDHGRDNQGHAIWIPGSSPHRLYPDIEDIVLAFLKNHTEGM